MAVNMNRLAAPPFGLMGALSRQSYILQGQENGFPDRRNQNGSGAGGVGHNIQVTVSRKKEISLALLSILQFTTSYCTTPRSTGYSSRTQLRRYARCCRTSRRTLEQSLAA